MWWSLLGKALFSRNTGVKFKFLIHNMTYYAAQQETKKIKDSIKSAVESGVNSKNGNDIRTVLNSW